MSLHRVMVDDAPAAASQFRDGLYIDRREIAVATSRTGGDLRDLEAALTPVACRLHVCRTLRDIIQCLKIRDIAVLLLDDTACAPLHDLTPERLGELMADHPFLKLIGLVAGGGAPSGHMRTLMHYGWLHDYHTLPIDASRLSFCLGHLYGLIEMQRRATDPESDWKLGYGALVGRSPVMRTLYMNIRRVAAAMTTVLITGESGTGKELVARTIHQKSSYATGQFVAINCAAIPATLIESELYGYEAGAFTGASQLKRGRIEYAHKGTLLLDEIGDMPLSLQPHFLRFLQDGLVKRLGGVSATRVDTRVIAATNVDLEKAIRDRRFREDLYYRLNTVTLDVPPLRDRQGDIEILAGYCLKKACAKFGRSPLHLSKRSLSLMNRYRWPGNVRELASVVQRAVLLSKGPVIRPGDLGLGDDRDNLLEVPTLAEARAGFERTFIHSHLQRNQNNVQLTARELGISRVTLYRLTRRHGINMSGEGSSDAEP
jgi:DNA-binding NtrC family response regulator